MATCFLNNVYCCYLPAHCSHGLQPLDNGVFNASKAAYRRELEKFALLTDSTPMDKVNFIRAYAEARRVGMTRKNILSGWRVTGNWPISRAKALRHPEIQQDRPNGSQRTTPEPRPYLDSDDTPQTSRQIRNLGLNKTPKTRRRYNVIAKGFEAQQQTVAAHTQRIASLEEELARLKRGKKRKAVPNPNRRFMTLGETLAVGKVIPEEGLKMSLLRGDMSVQTRKSRNRRLARSLKSERKPWPINGPRGQDGLSKDLDSDTNNRQLSCNKIFCAHLSFRPSSVSVKLSIFGGAFFSLRGERVGLAKGWPWMVRKQRYHRVRKSPYPYHNP
jgi:hypothetical protein